MNDLEELFGAEPSPEAVPAVQEVEQEAVVEPLQEVPASEPVSEPAEVEPVAPTINPLDGFVPVAVLKAEREKRQQYETVIAQYEQYLAAQMQPQYDENGYEIQGAYQQEQAEPQPVAQQDLRLAQMNIRMSEMVATQQFGVEAVQEAKRFSDELAKSNPDVLNAIQFGDDPFGDLIRYKQQSEMMADPAAFIRKNAAAFGFIPAQSAPAQVAQPQGQRTPIRSTSSLPSGGRINAAPASDEDVPFLRKG